MKIERLDKILGEGSSNWVYSLKQNAQIAVKISKNKISNLTKEAYILRILSHTNLFPKLQQIGELEITQNYNSQNSIMIPYLVIQRLGISLQQLMVLRQGKLNIRTIKQIGQQLLNKITVFHKHNIIHNDIKPSNILFGLKEKRKQAFIVDFQLADIEKTSIFYQQIGKSYVCQQKANKFKGNIKFASLRKLKGLKGHHCGKLDDIQSLLYILLWILFGGRNNWPLQMNFSERLYDINPNLMNVEQRITNSIQLKTKLIINIDYHNKQLQNFKKKSFSKDICQIIIKLNSSVENIKIEQAYWLTQNILFDIHE